MKTIPLRATMCASCPFRPGSKYAFLAPELTVSALTESNRICHSTGSSGIHKRTGKPEHVCRGAREVQLQAFVAAGVLDAATDACWNERRVELGMKPEPVKEP